MRYRLGPASNHAYESLRSEVLCGKFSPAERLPSQTALAARLVVAPATLRRALAYLEEEGLLVRKPGIGLFVSSKIPSNGSNGAASRRVRDGREHQVDDANAATSAHQRDGTIAPADLLYAYRTVFNGAPIGISLSNLAGYFLVANETYQRMVGYSEDELRQLRFTDITHPDDVEADLALYHEAMAGRRTGYEMKKRYIRKDGHIVHVRLRVVVLRDETGAPSFDVAMVEDMTERERAEEALLESEARYRQMFERNPAIKLLIDPQSGRIVDANPAASRFYGYTRDDMQARRITEMNVLPADRIQREIDRAEAEEKTYFVFRHRLASGEIRDVEVHSSPVDVNGTTLLYSVIHDVTERTRFERELAHQAHHDSLTNLPNRALLLDRLQHGIRTARRQNSLLALILLDLNRFKEINDTFGHRCGDKLLQQFAERLRPMVRESDTVARLGGDEFVLLLPNADETGAIEVVRKVRKALKNPFVVKELRFHIDTSIGITLFPDHETTADGLLRAADVAMYAAKHSNASYVVYSLDHDENSRDRVQLASELHEAVETSQIYLHFQPKRHLRSGRPCGVEALARWSHPRHGMVPPDQFIPLAERTGLIEMLTFRVLNQALHQCRIWRDQGLEIEVAVNLSAHSLRDPHLAELVADLLRTHGVPASALELEITESAVMTDPVCAMTTLTHLHDLGLQVSIDDFGTGYSSLGQLRRLPVSQIKIDRSFVKDMGESHDDAFIVRTIIDLGRNLHLQTVAEGVEDGETMDMLLSMGCDVAQGYVVSHPLSAEECTQWFKDWDKSLRGAV